MSNFYGLKPHISEKSFGLSAMGKYVFLVSKDANKVTVKEAIEKLFKVSVIKVNMINIPGKVKRSKTGVGKRKGVVKAVVTLKKGERIDLFETEEAETEKKSKVQSPESKDKAKGKAEIKTEVVKEVK
jgi:large subunit ribosomal protein L23